MVATDDTNKFKPNEHVHKILISTTSRMVGEYSNEGMLISHAWPCKHDHHATIRFLETPASRTGFVLAFETPPREKSIVIPDYSPTGDAVCSYLSVLFGKRFDCHGLTEGSGFYNIPNLNLFSTLCDQSLSFNSHRPRNDFVVPLRMENFGAMLSVLEKLQKEPGLENKLRAACNFYMQSLKNAEQNIEVAYLHLVSAGEVLSSVFTYEEQALYDEETRRDLSRIRTELSNGEKVANRLSRKMYWVKRRFINSLYGLLDSRFFIGTEQAFSKENVKLYIAGAYDLRSKYIHSGIPFGHWVKPSGRVGDVPPGKWVVEDKELEGSLNKAPTYIGLERLVRFCILAYLDKFGPLKFIKVN